MAEHWLVSGANRGIGRELARRVAARGDHVTASVRNEAVCARLAPEVAHFGAGFSTLVFDVRDETAIGAAARDVALPLDVLVCNAGVAGPQRQSPLDMDFEGALDTFSVNTLGPLRLVQAFLPALRQAKNPRIVIVSSILGSMARGASMHIVYCASKAALNKMAQGLAAELRPEGITAVALHPGWVRTDMGGADADLSVEESVAGIIAAIDGLTLSSSGRFLDYLNKDAPW
ncbi:MAG: SDR family oxidoreductase [Methylocystis sp.]|nr:SDR family oxidoreductase [Methylocystis sp.]MBI3274673.1 SDR family oxidoreductase [Methylocystis sp.]